MGGLARALLAGAALALATGPLALLSIAQSPLSRTIALRNIHTDEVVSLEYKRNGRYVPEAMQKINWVMRDWRREEATQMDPALIDLLWEMHRELGSKQPINLISAYRSRTTNNMLRKTVGGQASESRHILGKAADVQFPDVPIKHLRYAAMIRERGGVGYYPTSATPFVHVDTDRVRAWPRMPRFELALLFPNGRTEHKPADGGDLTADDVRQARSRQPEIATQLAAFHDMRRKGGRDQPSLMTALAPGAADIVFTPDPRSTAMPAAVAAVTAPQKPQLLAEPRLIDRPQRLTVRPSDSDRRVLSQLVALAGLPELVAAPALAVRPAAAAQAPKRKGDALPESGVDALGNGPYPRLAFLSPQGMAALAGWSTGFTPAPAWDEDHPEEAAYRPFPLTPMLTATSSIDDPALVKLVHPDLARTGELFDVDAGAAQMKLRPGAQAAQLLWSQDAQGSSVDIDRLSKASGDQSAVRPMFTRLVQTQPAR